MEAEKLFDADALANDNVKPPTKIKASNDEMNRVLKIVKENQRRGEKLIIRIYNRKLDLNKEKKTIKNTN